MNAASLRTGFRCARSVLLGGFLLAGAACGGERETAGSPEPPDVAPPASTADTVATAQEPSAGTAGPVASTEPAAPQNRPLREDERQDGPGEWTVGVVEGGEPGTDALIRELRGGRHDTYDRLVLEFADGPVPEYRVEYVDRPLHECGSGHQIHPPGDAWLQVRLQGARGHTEAGEATLAREPTVQASGRLLRLYRPCDFEGVVELVAALPSPEPFRAFTLREPTRLVLDIRRP